MSKCAKCGADRTLVGVRFPTRRLCRCEKNRPCGHNNCASAATIVEFQQPQKGDPDAPLASSKAAQLSCDAHGPAEFVDLDSAAAPAPKKQRGPKGLPYVDPQWGYERPPVGAMSSSLTQCWSCKDVHKMKERRMHNGSKSLCPKCGDDVTTHADEEEVA